MRKSRATISDVAREAHVSKGLVSLAFNDKPGVSAESKRRILEAADVLGWKPSLRARSLSVDQSFALGLVVARSADILASDPFFPAFIAGIEQVVAPRGQALVLSLVESPEAEAESYRQLVDHDRVDGVILTDLRTDDSRLRLIEELGLFAVVLGRPSVPSAIPSVGHDDAAGIAAAVEHLVALGHKRIAHVGGPDFLLHSVRRRAAFEGAMTRAGLDGRHILKGDFGAADGARLTRELLESGSRPTAIVYANDPMAIAGMGTAQRMGLEVPADLSITGFDGSEIGKHVFPALTTVITDPREWGRRAAETLLARISGSADSFGDLDAARFTVRDSTARPAERPVNSGIDDPGGPRAF